MKPIKKIKARTVKPNPNRYLNVIKEGYKHPSAKIKRLDGCLRISFSTQPLQ